MMKKSLISILVFCLIAIICSPVFASEDLKSGTETTLNNIKDGVQNMVNGAGNAMENAKDGISNMMNDGANAVKDDTKKAENGIENMTRDNTTSTDEGYTASRTSSELTATGTNTATVWVVLAIAGILIIALVWYYGMQTQTNGRDHY